ncbi:hypothetical protein C8R42DRAFT_720765 [Lentinula raphanica]|nr:hypothetical protein C8R42DRAFT_720765 [Lentinula raphanica]
MDFSNSVYERQSQRQEPHDDAYSSKVYFYYYVKSNVQSFVQGWDTFSYFLLGHVASSDGAQGLEKGRGICPDRKRLQGSTKRNQFLAQIKPKGGEHDKGLLENLEDIIDTSNIQSS